MLTMKSNSGPYKTIKISFLGDVSVGKTSIINNIMYSSFNTKYAATIGVDYLSKTINLNGENLQLQLWDTAGQERFRSVVPLSIRYAKIAVVVYDITNVDTFDKITQWIDEIRQVDNSDVQIILVGNKLDLSNTKRAVSVEEGVKMAQKLNAIFLETSAKGGINIKELLLKITSIISPEDNRSEAFGDIVLQRRSLCDLTEKSNKSRCTC